MAGITLTQAETQLASYIDAETAVLSGQEFRIDTGNGYRMLKRADLAEIRSGISYWQARVRDLTRSASGRSRMRYLVR